MNLDALIDRFRGPLVGLIVSFGAPRPDAIELAQDVFAEAFLGRERFRGSFEDDEAVGRWLRGIARNLHHEWRRSSERHRAQPLSETLAHSEETPEPSPHRDALENALAALSPDQRTAVQMFYLEQASLRSVAGLLGVTEKTVEGRLYRARRELQRRLIQETTGGSQ